MIEPKLSEYILNCLLLTYEGNLSDVITTNLALFIYCVNYLRFLPLLLYTLLKAI